MNDKEREPLGLLNSTQELRQLIIDNPDLPLLVFAGEDASGCDYGYTSCSRVSASIGEFLDCSQTVDDEKCYTDRDDFEEDLRNHYDDYSEEELEELNGVIDDELAEYDKYWKKCIILYVDN